MSIEQCEKCEYLQYCFWGLKFVQMYLSNEPCKQGRKRKVMKQTTLSDIPRVLTV